MKFSQIWPHRRSGLIRGLMKQVDRSFLFRTRGDRYQCDQTLEVKAAQFSTNLLKKGAKAVFALKQRFLNTTYICLIFGLILHEKMSPKTFQKQPSLVTLIARYLPTYLNIQGTATTYLCRQSLDCPICFPLIEKCCELASKVWERKAFTGGVINDFEKVLKCYHR